jgi:hypothetical protein
MNANGFTSTPSKSLARSPRSSRAVLASAALLIAATTLASCSNGGGGGGDEATAQIHMIEHWNGMSIDASGLDHMPSNQGPPHTFGQQVGPCRAARAVAIVHIAMFEAMNAIEQKYQSYTGLPPAPKGTSMRAAVSQASHDALVALFPSQAAIFDADLTSELNRIGAGPAKTNGIALGQAAAAGILAMRTNDGSQLAEPHYGVEYIAGNGAGEWRQDPITLHPLALGADWNQVTPFVMTSADQFRCPVPPAITSPEYAFAYDEAKLLGGDGVVTPTIRTEEETFIGTYWAYDGTPSLCAPPRLYNQITMQIAHDQHTKPLEMARLLVLVNVAMADAGIASWESKYFYKFWRPVTAIRESDPGTGPSGTGDGNALTVGDATFSPLGAPASNTASGLNFTPPFPSYPSGHATFGGALFQTLRRFYGTDDIAFTFVSDEYNGVTADNSGVVRPLLPRSFTTLSQAEEENGRSRIYLGIHWRFDKTAGIAEGNSVGDWVFDHIYQPVP